MSTEKTSLENESQPSCLGAVSGSFPYSIYEEDSWNIYKKKPIIILDGELFIQE